MSNFKDVNLYDNLPDFMQQYKEIQAIFNIENVDLTKLWNEIEEVLIMVLYFLQMFQEYLNLKK